MLTPSPVILSPFAHHRWTALNGSEGAQDKLREGSRQFTQGKLRKAEETSPYSRENDKWGKTLFAKLCW